MTNVGKRALKLFKMNMFTVDEVARLCNVDEETLEREFRKWCGDSFIYPGVYLVGGWVDKIVDAMDKWKKVIVVGDPGSGKTINSLHAAKKISKNIGHVYSLPELDMKINARHKGVILVDDVDLMGRKWKTILEKASLVKNLRVIATSTKNVVISGFHTIRIKPPRGKEMEELASIKGWKMIKGARNLVDLVKANVYNGGMLEVKPIGLLKEVRNVLGGDGSREVDKGVIEQVVRNGYEMDHSLEKTEELTKAAAGAWLFMFSRGDPSALLSTIKKTSGAASIMFRKGVVNA